MLRPEGRSMTRDANGATLHASRCAMKHGTPFVRLQPREVDRERPVNLPILRILL